MEPVLKGGPGSVRTDYTAAVAGSGPVGGHITCIKAFHNKLFSTMDTHVTETWIGSDTRGFRKGSGRQRPEGVHLGQDGPAATAGSPL
jgi:hypothetical protein